MHVMTKLAAAVTSTTWHAACTSAEACLWAAQAKDRLAKSPLLEGMPLLRGMLHCRLQLMRRTRCCSFPLCSASGARESMRRPQDGDAILPPGYAPVHQRCYGFWVQRVLLPVGTPASA